MNASEIRCGAFASRTGASSFAFSGHVAAAHLPAWPLRRRNVLQHLDCFLHQGGVSAVAERLLARGVRGRRSGAHPVGLRVGQGPVLRSGGRLIVLVVFWSLEGCP